MATIVLRAATTTAANNIFDKSAAPSEASYNFNFSPFLRENALAALASEVPVCETYASSGHCPLGRRCPKRHPTPNQAPNQHHYGRNNDNYVCKHWLKGLCKKGDECDYLHEYNLRKMSECQFYNQNGYCQNGDECLYVHVKEDSKLPVCEDYNAGFCEKGPKCGKRHVRRKLSVKGKPAEDDRRRRVEDLERREEENKRDFRGRGGKGGRWRDRKRRNP
ncbi:RNA-binding component of cleavage and polyadenylation factor [Lithohypha guttulata]|uniref:mRNA 3'-end-processing protein n=1 Tax=Lithohypha guttulata TaxID=1690604 RepID=A0AAN7Y8A3_9EURO|nr:RNA-binding component of cleavage and polyadenylation factor [Lithohypha guttulata]KAK5088495.1 RNA-binding component of cleavage and polyadenylation factor [Lithohypha guttulata]KAK5106976.1 RNA-binding component of cleavage and polyadenylation factor [Lithohypha guttulata]